MAPIIPRTLLFLSALTLSSCALGPRTWTYKYQRGKTAIMQGPYAVPPAGLPPRIYAAIQAGNRITGRPYKSGGGHRSFEDSGYDCSGAVSYILHAAALLDRPSTSTALRKFGRSGKGRHITIYARRGHCFIEVAGLRFDTGWHGQGQGPRWTTRPRPLRGFRARSLPGL